MGMLDEARYIERQHFFDGQRLAAEDMQGLEGFNREMRWLHNASLHQPGIGNGYAVRGYKGARLVQVDPGYAIDARGREIVLVESVQLDVPPVAGETNGDPVYYDLVVSYPDDTALEVVETREGVCAPRGATRLREQPVFCWVRLRRTQAGRTLTLDLPTGAQVKESLVAADARVRANIAQGMSLVVARIEVLNCQLNHDISTAERRNARPALGPHLASGELTPSDWAVFWWTPDLPADVLNIITAIRDEGAGNAFTSLIQPLIARQGEVLLGAIGPLILPIGFEVVVPTGLACFRTVPRYTLRLGGERLLQLDLNDFLQELELPRVDELATGLSWQFYCEGLLSVQNPQQDQFTARVALMIQLLDIDTPIATVQAQNQVQSAFTKTDLGRKLQESVPEGEAARATHNKEVADLSVKLAVKLLEKLVPLAATRLQWSLAWIGVEG